MILQKLLSGLRRLLTASTDGIVESVVWLSSNRLIFAGIIVITILWLTFNSFMPHPFDDPHKGYVKLVLWYTIVFGIWEGAQKVVQAVQMKRDHYMQDLMLKGIAVSQQSLESISELVAAIREELDRSMERDEIESEKTKTLVLLVKKLLAATQPGRGC